MNCKDAHKEFLFLAEGSVSQTKEQELRRHLAECEKCHSLYAKVSETYALVEAEKIKEVNPFFFSRIEQNLLSRKQKKTKYRSLQKVLEPLVLAAVIVLGLFLGALIGNKSQIQAENTDKQVQIEEVFYLDDNELAYESVEAYLMSDDSQ